MNSLEKRPRIGTGDDGRVCQVLPAGQGGGVTEDEVLPRLEVLVAEQRYRVSVEVQLRPDEPDRRHGVVQDREVVVEVVSPHPDHVQVVADAVAVAVVEEPASEKNAKPTN